MKQTFFRSLMCLFVALLGACSAAPAWLDTSGLDLRSQIASRFQRPAPPPTPDQIRASIRPEALDQLPNGILYVEGPLVGLAGVLVRDTQARGLGTYRSGGLGLSLKGPGILVATRGLGDDLMAADVADLTEALSTGSAAQRLVRIHDTLSPEEKIVRTSYLCDLSAPALDTTLVAGMGTVSATRQVETCAGPDGTIFENSYWTTPDGLLRASQQWAGPRLGILRIEVSKP